MEGVGATPLSSCAQCGASTTKTCSGCMYASSFLEGAEKTYYCSKECQQKHWVSHKAICVRARRHQTMYQGGELLQMLWTVLRTETFPSTIDRVQFDGNTIAFWETFDGIATTPFPHHMFQDDKVKQAVLDYGACGDALFHMRKLVQELFSAISLKIEEVTYKVKGRKWCVMCYNRKQCGRNYTEISNDLCHFTGGPPAGGGLGDERVFDHQVFVASLKGDREGFVIDLASGQYGHFDTVMPVNKYFAERVRKLSLKQPLGTYDETFGSLFGETNSLYFERLQFGALRIHSLLRTWLAEKDLTLTGLVSLDKASFRTKLAVLKKHTCRGLQATAKESLKCGDLMVSLKQAKTPEEKARLARERLDLLKASGITIDMMQPQNRSWFQCRS